MFKPACAVLAILLLVAPAAANEVTVLPLGDSITEVPAYRYALWKKLVDAGYKPNFMGSKNKGQKPAYKGVVFDADYEATWGISAHWLYATKPPLPARLAAIKKANNGRLIDFATYHIGTNDANTKDLSHGKKYVSGATLKYIEMTIDALQAHNPDVTILLCQIIPIDVAKTKQPVRQQVIDYFNGLLPELAKRKSTKRSRVIIVDQRPGFDPTSGKDTFDGIHPNDRGGKKMADKFFQAIGTARKP